MPYISDFLPIFLWWFVCVLSFTLRVNNASKKSTDFRCKIHLRCEETSADDYPSALAVHLVSRILEMKTFSQTTENIRKNIN